ncbi:MAG: PDDEXK nuclease domain-containing protein [Pseudomonadota bacterium]
MSDTMRPEFYQSIAEILRNARSKAYHAVNFTMVEAYWNVGRRIVEEEQQGERRAEYGAALLKALSRRLTEDFGPGFDETNLRKMRQFYAVFQKRDMLCLKSTDEAAKRDTPCLVSPSPEFPALRRELSWSHYRLLMRVEKPVAREWYMNEAAETGWSVSALNRQINSLYYERLLMSRDKTPVVNEMREKTVPHAPQPEDFIKDPYVLEFLGIPDSHKFRESELEQAIIGKLQAFLLELGKGFSFVARQKRISTETKDFFVDLVFYNYMLKCFVLVDLKTGELTHQDIGQMDMYVRLYEETVKGPDDNPTIGIILCTEKDRTIVKYSVLKENRRLFAAKYQLYLPTEEELRKELEREREWFIRERAALYSTEYK